MLSTIEGAVTTTNLSDADDLTLDLSRVVVVGTSCSGKSTFAQKLAARLGSSHVELDALHWLPGWIEREQSTFLQLVSEQTAGERWVADGNYSSARKLLWSRASAIIWLDYPFPLVLWRAFKRTAHRATTGRMVCNGNRETWRTALLSRQSILLWVITTWRKQRYRYSALFEGDDYRNAAKIKIGRPVKAARLLASVKKPNEKH